MNIKLVFLTTKISIFLSVKPKCDVFRFIFTEGCLRSFMIHIRHILMLKNNQNLKKCVFQAFLILGVGLGKIIAESLSYIIHT